LATLPIRAIVFMGQGAKQILIVDDNGNDVALFRRILERAGYVVSGLQSGKQAVSAIEKRPLTW
jgi:CheY-like chemotaxis protein